MNNEEKYIEAFNRAYLLAKEDLAMYEIIIKAQFPDKDYSSGFLDGGEQFFKEEKLERLNQLKGIQKDKDLGRSK